MVFSFLQGLRVTVTFKIELKYSLVSSKIQISVLKLEFIIFKLLNFYLVQCNFNELT